MNKCMLVGAVGLALAGVALASDDGAGLARSVRVNTSTFTQIRNAALGDAGSNHRAEILAQLRSEIAAGNIDPRTVVFVINEDLIPGSGHQTNLSSGGNSPTEVPLGSNAQFFDDASTYQLTSFVDPPTSLISINGQTNPAGFVFGGQPWTGAATDAVMTNVGPNNPPGGGIAPLTQPLGGEPYIALARRTGLDGLNPNFQLNFNERHQLFSPAPDPNTGHTRLSTDWYLKDAGTSQWWSPVSFTEGFVLDRMFFGGTKIGTVLGFAEDPNGILNNFVSLGVLAGNFTIGQFYAPPRDALFPFPINKWFSMMAVLAQNTGGGIGYGMFIKTPDTIANGFLDPRMASGAIIPTDKDPAGWVNTYPGIVDDAGTPGQIEGIGLASTQFGEIAPNNGAFGLSTILAAVSASGTQFGRGLDPPAAVFANFMADDAFIDNYIAKGVEFVRPCPLPDFIIPYHDTMEYYIGGAAIRLQTDRYFDGLSSNSVISILQNTTPPNAEFPNPRQSLGQQNVNNDNLYRDEFDTDVPVFPAQVVATTATPMVASAQIRMSSTGGSPRTGRALRLFDGAQDGNFVGTVLLGATDPTGAFAQADGRVWVRQPNVGSNGIWGTPPGFDRDQDAENNLSQGNWKPESAWAFPPNNAPFNTQFINVPTGAMPDGSDGMAVSPNSFNLIQMSVSPNPNEDPRNPFDDGVMTVSVNGTQVFPNGDPAQQWLASGFSGSNIQFWSSNNTTGQFEVIHVDDIWFDGPIFTPNPGPPYTIPYWDLFEGYVLDRTIDGQGDTPLLNNASMPDAPANDSSRKLTVLDSNSNVPVDGTLVCRYTVDLVKLGSGLLAVGDTVALNFDALPLPFNTFLDTNVDCPGSGPTATASGVSTPFVVRPGENMTRVEAGDWTLQNLDNLPEPFATANGDNPNLSFSFTTLSRWFVPGANNVALVKDDPTMPGNAVLQLISDGGFDGSLTNNPTFQVLGSTLPIAQSTAELFPNPATDVVMTWDLYIESVDVNNMPAVPLQAPRSRLEIPIIGATGNGGQITRIMYGGPNVNNHSALQDPNPPLAPIIAPDEISVAIAQPDGLIDPTFQFVDTGVSLINGGAGITGPLLNTWFRTIFTLRSDGTYDVAIDEDRDGPGAPVIVATGTAIELGNIGTGGAIVNTSDIGFFGADLGFDIGSGGEPTVTPFRIHTFNGPSGSNWDAVGPSNGAADHKSDYCWYETNTTEFELVGSQAQIAPIATAPAAGDGSDPNITGELAAPIALSQNNDVIAVINRAFDTTTQMLSGPLIHDPCPLNLTTGINKFELSNSAGVMVYAGRWGLDDQVGQSGVNNPSPAGGISRPNGPTLALPVSYNDPLAEPAGFPATIAARPIILALWGSDSADANQGVDPTPAVLPRSRWFIDWLHIEEIGGPLPCANLAGDPTVVDGADLATLLVQWGGPGSADLNGDGVVNGSDLAILLVNWGPCP